MDSRRIDDDSNGRTVRFWHKPRWFRSGYAGHDGEDNKAEAQARILLVLKVRAARFGRAILA